MTKSLNGYTRIGIGPRKVLMMNGWFGSSKDWEGLVNTLDKDAFTCIFFDYRGYGLSRDRAGEFTFEEAAQDVLAIVDHFGWDKFSLVGHSMGGVAIQRVLLAAAPLRIERMAAICAVPACGSRMNEERLAGFRTAVDDVEKRAGIIAHSTGNKLPAHITHALAHASLENSLPEAFAAYLPQWATKDFSEHVKGNQTPVKLFVGENDPTLTAEVMAKTWKMFYPNAVVEMIEGSGHYPMYETPTALALALNTWLA
jgi:esterase